MLCKTGFCVLLWIRDKDDTNDYNFLATLFTAKKVWQIRIVVLLRLGWGWFHYVSSWLWYFVSCIEWIWCANLTLCLVQTWLIKACAWVRLYSIGCTACIIHFIYPHCVSILLFPSALRWVPSQDLPRHQYVCLSDLKHVCYPSCRSHLCQIWPFVGL